MKIGERVVITVDLGGRFRKGLRGTILNKEIDDEDYVTFIIQFDNDDCPDEIQVNSTVYKSLESYSK